MCRKSIWLRWLFTHPGDGDVRNMLETHPLTDLKQRLEGLDHKASQLSIR